MKTNSAKKAIALVFVVDVLAISGCYTVLMHPSVLTSSEKEYSPQAYSHGDFTSEISYNQNCLNCHSQAELDDRYYDMQRVGIRFAHGMNVDPYGWRMPSTSVPWWIEVVSPVPSPAIGATSSTTTEAGPRRRSSGSTRGEDGTRSRENTSASTPVTTTTTTTAPATSAATSTTRSSTSTSSQATSTDRSRTTGTTSKEPATRKSGSTRGEDPK